MHRFLGLRIKNQRPVEANLVDHVALAAERFLGGCRGGFQAGGHRKCDDVLQLVPT